MVGSVALGDFFVCLVVSMNITCGDITCGDITCAPCLSPQQAARYPTDQHLLSVHWMHRHNFIHALFILISAFCILFFLFFFLRHHALLKLWCVRHDSLYQLWCVRHDPLYQLWCVRLFYNPPVTFTDVICLWCVSVTCIEWTFCGIWRHNHSSCVKQTSPPVTATYLVEPDVSMSRVRHLLSVRCTDVTW